MTTAQIMEIKRRERKNRERLLTMNPYLIDDSGIYVFVRTDESGLRFAYIGQAKRILTRLAQHLDGYDQHIDLSLKKRGLFSVENPYGWYVMASWYPADELDAQEQAYIKRYADNGYQLLNKTGGGQGKGKHGIAPNKPAKGYYDGKKQGKRDVVAELNKVVKYLQIEPKNDGKLANRMAAKFWAILGEQTHDENN